MSSNHAEAELYYKKEQARADDVLITRWLVKISFNKQQFVDLDLQSPISIKESMLK